MRQHIQISNHDCTWDEIIDACERHGLKPEINSSGKYQLWVKFQVIDTEMSWFLKWSFDEDWQSYWKERDELS